MVDNTGLLGNLIRQAQKANNYLAVLSHIIGSFGYREAGWKTWMAVRVVQPHMSSNPSVKNQKIAFWRRRSWFLPSAAIAVVVAIVFGFAFFSQTAHASVTSFLWSAFGKAQASAVSNYPSVAALDSQIYPLPSYPANAVSLPDVASSSTTPPLDGNDALSAEAAAVNNVFVSEPLNTQISIYVVRSGDTLSGVAEMFNVSVNTILWANNLNSRSVLRPGDTLVILPVTGISYTVVKNDTIQGIAKKYHADIGDILNYNDLTLASTLNIGDHIIIPDAEIAAPAAPTYTSHRITSVPFEPLLDGWGWPSYPGYFVCPVPGARLTQGLHGHNAVDLAIGVGTPIRASASGTVIISRSNGAWNGGYGNFVVILHPNGTQTLYAHMSHTAVSAGAEVRQGQTIGYIGMTGLTTGPHVHFEIRGAQNPFVDPSLCR